MNTSLNIENGSFSYQGKTYTGYLQQGENRTPLTDLEVKERKRILKAASDTFEQNVEDVSEVSRAVFSDHGSRLHIDYYEGKNTDPSHWVDLPLDTPSATKLQGAIRTVNGFEMPAPPFIEVGLERKRGEQTCYANAFLQLQIGLMGKELDRPFRDSRPDEEQEVYAARKGVWEALQKIRQEMREAKKGRRAVAAEHVACFLQAAHALGQRTSMANDWDNPIRSQDLIEFWSTIRNELDVQQLPDSLNPNDWEGQALYLDPQKSESIQAFVDGLADENNATAPPKTLPIAIDRFNAERKRDYTPLAINENLSLTIGGRKKTYRLVGAAQHLSGHYVAYRRDDKSFLQFDDATVKRLSTSGALDQIQTTSTLLIYELQG